jgi:hypothetical protein
MAIPTIYFLCNSTSNDVPYVGTGADNATYSGINVNNDKLVFTGGGIDDSVLTTPTCASGIRSSTIRPSVSSYVIPKTYVEDDTLMLHIPLVGHNANRYCMCVYVNGYASSDIYLEAWDDNTFSTTNLAVLQGSANSSNESYINAIRTTAGAPPWGPGWSGSDVGAAYLRGTDDRVPLANASSVTDQALYYNIYVRLQVDSATFHDQCVLAFRYLYT